MSYNNYLSYQVDQFIEDCDRTIWIAHLDDGTCVYQDDDRPNYEPSAWHRLKNHCETNNINIVDLYLKFRSNRVNIGKADGYFFIKAVLGRWGAVKNFHFYKIGKLLNNKLIVEKWKVPELQLESTEERSLNEDIIQQCLILNKYE